MRNLISLFVVVLFGLTGVAQAASETATQIKTKKTEFSAEQLKGLSFVGYYNTSNRLPIKAAGSVVKGDSEGAFGFGAQYEMKLAERTNNMMPGNFIGGVVFETPREITAVTDQGTKVQITGAKPSFSMLLAYANADFEFAKQASFFGGLNFPIPFESDFGDISLSGQPGYQIGISLDVAENFAADVSHRWINLRGNNQLNRIDIDGLMFQGRYIF